MEVDNLTVKLTAEVDTAQASIKSLIGSLTSLQTKLEALNRVNLNGLVSSFKELDKAVNSVQLGNVAKSMETAVNKSANQMTKDIAKSFNILDGGQIENVRESVMNLAQAMTETANKGEAVKGGNFSGYMENMAKSIYQAATQTTYYNQQLVDLLHTVESLQGINFSKAVQGDDLKAEKWASLDGMLKQKLQNNGSYQGIDSLFKEWANTFNGLGIENMVGASQGDQVRYLNELIQKARELKDVQQDIGSMESPELVKDAAYDTAIKKTDELTRNINNLSTSFQTLQQNNALGFDTGTLEKIISVTSKIKDGQAENIEEFKNAVVSLCSELNGIGELKFNPSRLYEVIEAVKGMSKNVSAESTVGLQNLGTNLADVTERLNSAGSVTYDPSSLVNIVGVIGKLGGVKATQGTANLESLAQHLTNFVTEMNGIGSVTFDSASLQTLVSNISRLGASGATQAVANLPQISQQLSAFVQQMNSLGSMTFDTTNLTSLVTAISRLGYGGVTQAITNIPQLATALSNLMSTLSNAPRVSQNLIDMTNALANLASQGSRSSSAISGLSSRLNIFGKSASGATKKAWSLASAIGKIYATYWLAFRAFNVFKKAINISADLTEVQNVVDVTFKDMAYKVDEFAENSIEKLGMSELALKTYASRFQSMGSAMGISSSQIAKANQFLAEQTDGYIEMSDSMADVSLNLTKLVADVSSLYNIGRCTRL
jgi:CII-binding regulator of phage lambda lysogenization HflD